ncbi:MAG: hypothetical protein IPL23_02610 [Saprospiraceae bacterium]|nr:hypothetical protein [Saprospiraceae bacterium]
MQTPPYLSRRFFFGLSGERCHFDQQSRYLIAPDLKYNLSTKVADYTHKALMKDATNTLKSQYGTHNTATKESWFYTRSEC